MMTRHYYCELDIVAASAVFFLLCSWLTHFSFRNAVENGCCFWCWCILVLTRRCCPWSRLPLIIIEWHGSWTLERARRHELVLRIAFPFRFVQLFLWDLSHLLDHHVSRAFIFVIRRSQTFSYLSYSLRSLAAVTFASLFVIHLTPR